jgi:uncharacterized membrane protein
MGDPLGGPWPERKGGTSLMLSISTKTILILLVLAVALGTSVYLHSLFYEYDTQEEDIHFFWVEGKRILVGQNPYERVLSGDMRLNQKYATHFPLLYLLSALTQRVGLKGFPEWLSAWRLIFLLFNVGVALLIFYTVYRHNMPYLALFSCLIWLFNRWTLYVAQIAHTEFVPIFFLLLSFLLFDKHRWASLLLLGLSLAMKQIAIFLVPLYLIQIWRSSSRDAVREVLIAALAIASIPAALSLPFILWNVEGFVKSILFSVTRYQEAHCDVLSLDVMLGLSGIPARLPMFFLMALVYICATRRRIGMYTGALLTLFVFLGFNAVFFRQYMTWIIPFIPLSICDLARRRHLSDVTWGLAPSGRHEGQVDL